MSRKPSETLRNVRQQLAEALAANSMLQAENAHLKDEAASDALAIRVINSNNELLHEDVADRDETIGRLTAIIDNLRAGAPAPVQGRRQQAPVEMVQAAYGSDGMLHVGDKVYNVLSTSDISNGKMLTVGDRLSVQVRGEEELTGKIPVSLLAKLTPVNA